MSTFHQHHYNVVAKEIREQIEFWMEFGNHEELHAATVVLVKLAVRLAMRFQIDNPERFNAKMFLDRCSPDSKQYPFFELWTLAVK